MGKTPKITQQQAHAALAYDPESGALTWRVDKGRARAGAQAGWVTAAGRRLTIGGLTTTAARFIWFYVYGEWAAHEVRHVNGNPIDDRIVNLALFSPCDSQAALTAERLRERFTYDPATGLFKRLFKTRREYKRKTQLSCGWVRDHGYITIMVDGNEYRAHRLAWLYVHGVWPKEDLDHINGDPADNRISNLREATDAQNLANMKTPVTNTSGYKGVQWHKAAQKWTATFKHNGETYYLGLFENKEDARRVYREQIVRVKGEFARLD